MYDSRPPKSKTRARAPRHQLEAGWLQKVFINLPINPLERKYNGHGLPAGGCVSARRQVPITPDTASWYHGCGRSVPFDIARAQTLPPFSHGETGTPSKDFKQAATPKTRRDYKRMTPTAPTCVLEADWRAERGKGKKRGVGEREGERGEIACTSGLRSETGVEWCCRR